MAKINARFEASGLSLQEFGERMGYGRSTARKSAWQFLNSTEDPRLSMIEKAAAALGVDTVDLFKARIPPPVVLEKGLAEAVAAIYANTSRDVLSGHLGRHNAIGVISSATDAVLSGQPIDVTRGWDQWRRRTGHEIHAVGNPKTDAEYAAALLKVADTLRRQSAESPAKSPTFRPAL